jgi:hypothetical protein
MQTSICSMRPAFRANRGDCAVCLSPYDLHDAVTCRVCRTVVCRSCHRDFMEGTCVRCRRSVPMDQATQEDLDFDPAGIIACVCGWHGPALLQREHAEACPMVEGEATAATMSSLLSSPVEPLASSEKLLEELAASLRLDDIPTHPSNFHLRIPRDAVPAGVNVASVAALRAEEARRSIEARGGVTDCDAWYRLGAALALFEPDTRVSVASMTVSRPQCYANALSLALGPQGEGKEFFENRDWVANALYGLSQALRAGELVSIRGRLLSAEDCLIGALAACDGERAHIWAELGEKMPIRGGTLHLRDRAAAVARLLLEKQSVSSDQGGERSAALVSAQLCAAVLPPRAQRRDCFQHVLRLEPCNAVAYAKLAECMNGFRDTELVNGFVVTKQEAALLALGLDRRVGLAWRVLADTLEVGETIAVPSLPAADWDPVSSMRRIVGSGAVAENGAAIVSFEDCLTLAETFL